MQLELLPGRGHGGKSSWKVRQCVSVGLVVLPTSDRGAPQVTYQL